MEIMTPLGWSSLDEQASGILTWPHGDTATKDIRVPSIFDSENRRNVKYFRVVISNGQDLLHVVDEERRFAHITILAKKAGGVVSIEASPGTFTEKLPWPVST